ncbi:MAG: GntR family transcriptional regulator [Lachnospiraceae bacterium]|nr:GntR family transcriptional regulator [Lachnospiraceae bacterium]
MYIEIDFNSDEAIYVQLRNQIFMAIATSQIKEGESLPSVRALADTIGVNMHTVNKAYSTLRQDGFLKVDRRRGAVVAVDIDKLTSMEKMKAYLRPLIARGICKGLTQEEIKELVDDLYDELS